MKLVILGRDGVINAAPATYVDAPENWEPLPGGLEAIARLHRHGYRVVIVTHQPAVAHGALHMEALNRIHARMLDLVRHKGGEVEAIFVCPHGSESRCRCRPPLPGLFEELAERLKINLSGVAAVVATGEEQAAARAAGAQPVRIAAETATAPFMARGPRLDPIGETATAPGLMTGRTSEASRASVTARGPRLDLIGESSGADSAPVFGGLLQFVDALLTGRFALH